MTEFIQLIRDCGFPIACCAFLLMQQARQEEFYRTMLTEMRKSIDTLTDAVGDLTDYIKGVH